MAVPVSNVHIYYPGKIDSAGTVTSQVVTAIDLRKVCSWSTGVAIGSTATLNVRILGAPEEAIPLLVSKSEFETAKALSLAAEPVA